MQPRQEPTYVAISEIAVPAGGADDLEAAFADRLGKVDGWPGFLGLEVLRHRRRAGSYLMISRWESKEAFTTYMRSADHRESHDRIPGGPTGPHPAGFDDYNLGDWCRTAVARRSGSADGGRVGGRVAVLGR